MRLRVRVCARLRARACVPARLAHEQRRHFGSDLLRARLLAAGGLGRGRLALCARRPRSPLERG